MSEAEVQSLLIAGAIALGGFTIGLLAGLLRGQNIAERVRTSLGEHNETLQGELAMAQRQLTALEVERDQLHSRLQDQRRLLEDQGRGLEQVSRRYHALQNEHTRLHTQQEEREEQHLDQLELLKEARDNLKQEFEVLANRIFEDKGKHFTSTSRDSLEALLKPFREQISGFQSRINEVHTESVKGQSVLEAEIRKVLEVGLEMNTQATNLTTALKGDKKTTGNWGEAQLERTLELAGLLPGDHYDSQASYTDSVGKRRLPDFVIKLPDNKCLVIDSKVSLVDYERAISAETEEEQANSLKAHAQAVRNHIDDLSSKDYAGLSGLDSPDFVLMFMAVEPAYIEAMKYNRDLFNYGYQQQVVLVSHTTLMPILRTVANLWMIDQSNREAREISTRAGEIYNQVCLVAERLQKLGNTLKAANNHYNQAVKGLAGQQGLHGKVERFRQLSGKASKHLTDLDPIHTDIEIERLEAIELAQLQTSEEHSAEDKVKLEVVAAEENIPESR
ncbi:DNA recombination protein RmuC [Pseudohalioglobus lutimaris]|uniref:DNA recombination protein RmuC n=1 Tax=Pseudohalioglobus lutimaris TaxID=1737061 RepID=A0A2N5X8Q3_9GAMM|nr:DNA recombination protein RmuC [Pseudohalioglobus lutimaris]PLW70877.1 DNA recombination protein RmuC [Pseudohalioglobus lutimaris]